MSEWKRIEDELPQEGEVVETKIDDEWSSQCVATMRFRRTNLCLISDYDVYTYYTPTPYYTPTHWRRKEAVNDDKHRH